MTTNTNQLDMIHCEAASRTYNHLNLYEFASHKDGIIKTSTSSGACVISDHGVNCTQVILYVNLTYYDQHNGSTIPIRAFTSDDNLKFFCIRYLTLGKADWWNYQYHNHFSHGTYKTVCLIGYHRRERKPHTVDYEYFVLNIKL